MGTSWFKVGAEGKKESEKKDTEAKLRAKNRGKGFRFWLKNDTSAKVTYLDSPNFFFSEHNLKIGGKFGNFFTCLADFDVCPIDESGDMASYAIAATIIDHRKYIGGDGTEYRDQKKLFVAKGRARQHLLKQINLRDNNLQFCHYDLSRGSSQTESNVGEDFNFEKRLNKKSLITFVKKLWDKQGKTYTDKDIEEFLTPFNYEEIFKPCTQEELRKIVGGEVPIGSAQDISIDSIGEDKDNQGTAGAVEEEIVDIEDLLE